MALYDIECMYNKKTVFRALQILKCLMYLYMYVYDT
jgi:hypothetical protein